MTEMQEAILNQFDFANDLYDIWRDGMTDISFLMHYLQRKYGMQFSEHAFNLVNDVTPNVFLLYLAENYDIIPMSRIVYFYRPKDAIIKRYAKEDSIK